MRFPWMTILSIIIVITVAAITIPVEYKVTSLLGAMTILLAVIVDTIRVNDLNKYD